MPRVTLPAGAVSRFSVGDSVRVKKLYPRVGHIRTPFYLRGKSGSIFRSLGLFLDPQDLADGRSGYPPLMLYQVKFEYAEVWTPGGERSCTSILADLFENWLELDETRGDYALIVCTLCSCYPKALLGLPPDWYKSMSYRSRMVIEPRAVLEKFGTVIPSDVEIRVVDSTADMRYLVLPMRPHNTEEYSEEELLHLVTRDCMIGVTLPAAAGM
jgi:Nitrile hydratase, alpha chain/Nitrile hydratase beta subunit